MNHAVAVRGGESPAVLVTGANGFIGRAVVSRLMSDGVVVTGAVRHPEGFAWERRAPSLNAEADWSHLLVDASVVVHAAGRAHVSGEKKQRAIDLFRAVNVGGTLRLAEQAAESGVRRFIFLSSIGVHGVQSERPLVETDTPCPQEPYAVSKLEAEQQLMALARKTGMEVVILRPPLVYGAGAPGNFKRLVDALIKGVPLPLGAVTQNRRTLVALDNLVDLILTCITHDAAANQVFLACDSEDLSTAELVRRLSYHLQVPSRIVSVPVWMLSLGAILTGRNPLYERLCGSLQVSNAKARELLGWVPPIGVDEAIRRAVNSHIRSRDAKK